MNFRLVIMTFSAAAFFSSAARANDKPVFPEVYNSQKESIPFLTAEEALNRMHLPEGFSATLFASEPDVQQPIAMTFDSRGRLWVAENYTYSESAINFHADLRDRILILEDSDQDGKAERRRVFWDQARKLTSVAVGFGGVYVTCPPELLFIPDANGDDVPDSEPVVLLDGFDHDKVRHTLANGLKFGPDGWLYGRHGIQATSWVGKPGTDRSERTPINGCIWRYHPTKHIFEVVAQGTTNPWGSDWDEHGELFFINTVIGHLWHAVPGAYFKRMYGEPFNPYIYENIDQTADHVHWDTREAWNDVNKGLSSSTIEAGGGHAHTGLMMYLGGNWPDQYRNTMFTLNFHGRRINNDRLERHGAGYMGRHAPDFMSIEDPWFRGIELLSGPDGAVYVADWSDIGECHDHNGVHRTSGRIYRISHGDAKRPFEGDLAKADSRQLVKLQSHRNEWLVRQSRQVLQERAIRGIDMSSVHSALRDQFANTQNVPHQLRLLWALHVTGGTTPEFLRKQLDHSNEHLRVWAIRLLTDQSPPSPELLRQFAEMAGKDSSGLVLTYLASALQRSRVDGRWPLANALSSRGEFNEDRMLPLLVWYGIEAAVPKAPQKAVDLVRTSRLSKVRTLTTRRIFEDPQENAEASAGIVWLMKEDAPAAFQADILKGINDAIEDTQKPSPPANWEIVLPQLLVSSDPAVRTRAREIDARFGSPKSRAALARVLSDSSLSNSERRRALDILVQTRAGELPGIIDGLLFEPELAPAAIRAMGRIGTEDTPQRLLAAYDKLNPQARREAVNTLVSRPAFAIALLRAVQRGHIPRNEIGAAQLRQLHSHEDARLDERISAIWPQMDDSPNSKRELFSRLKSFLNAGRLKVADTNRGRELYQQSCAPCHKLYGEGSEIGPELTGADRHNLDYLLENILNPSGVVPENYRAAVVTMKDERVLNGIVTAKNEQSLTLQTISEKLTLPRQEIESIHESELSMMPDGLLDGLTDAQISDLFAYLMSNGPASSR